MATKKARKAVKKGKKLGSTKLQRVAARRLVSADLSRAAIMARATK